MTRPSRRQFRKESSIPMGNPSFGEEYIEYGSYSNTERPVSEESDASSKTTSDRGKPKGYGDYDSSSDESLFGQIHIRKRQRFSTQERDILEEVYQKSERPSADVKHNLANELNTSVNRVQIWFQNRRAKQKKSREQGRSRTSMPNTEEPGNGSGSRNGLKARKDSNEISRQAPSRHASMSYGLKRPSDDNGSERHQEKSRHTKKEHTEGNPPGFTLEPQSVYSLVNPLPPTYYCRTPLELVPSTFYLPGYPPSTRVGPAQPGQQGSIIPYVNPQRMHGTEQSGLSYGVPVRPVISPTSTYRSHSQEHDNVSMTDYPEHEI